MPTPVEFITLVAPEYVGDPRLALAIAVYAEQVAADHCYRDEVIALLAADMLASGDAGARGGDVVSETEGGLSRTYSVRSDSSQDGTSAYYKRALMLTMQCYGFSAMTKNFHNVPSA